MTAQKMTSEHELIDRYFAAWNEVNPQRRRDLIDRTWTEDSIYVDPMVQGSGRSGIDAMIGGVQTQFPGLSFRRLGEVNQHHDRLRFAWEFGPQAGPALAGGVDFGLTCSGLLQQVAGFIDFGPKPVGSGATISDPNVVRTHDGVSLFYRDLGQGKPLVFLSGWTLNSEMWFYQMHPLSQQGFRCIAYDRRSHGRSSDPGKGYDFDTLAADLDAIVDALDLQDATVVAHSFASGEIVRYLCTYRSPRVGRVILLAPAAIPFLLKTPDNPTGIDGTFLDQFRQMLAQDFPGWAEANAEPYFVPGTPRSVIDWTLRMMTQTPLHAAVEMNRIQTSTDFRDELSLMRVPTLLIHGDRDASFSLEMTSKPAAALIPGARLLVYEGAPHGLYFTHQERLNHDIAQFAGQVQ